MLCNIFNTNLSKELRYTQKFREINFDKEYIAIKRSLGQKLAYLGQQCEEPINRPISTCHLFKLTSIYQ